jgi:hypothetical protein
MYEIKTIGNRFDQKRKALTKRFIVVVLESAFSEQRDHRPIG